jgi:[ribosomal protein S18]-alanine N-acetyltransferase
MPYTIRSMSEPQARAVLSWQYEAPYDVYSVEPEDLELALVDLLDPENGYYSVHDERGELVGFCCFGPDARVPGGSYTEPALDVGLGLRPDLTGQGMGLDLLTAALDFARRHYAPVSFRTTIAAFNQRSIHVHEKAGFVARQSFRNAGSRAGSEWVQLTREA